MSPAGFYRCAWVGADKGCAASIGAHLSQSHFIILNCVHMPVEIRELQVRVTVNGPTNQPENGPAAAAPQAGTQNDPKALIDQCIEQVLDMLHNKKER